MAYEFVPSVALDASGREVPNFDGGEFHNSDYTEELNASTDVFDESDFVWDQATGSYRHKLDLWDETDHKSYDEDYVDEDAFINENYNMTLDELPDDAVEELMDTVGGVAQYRQLTAWAYSNLDQQSITEYDAAMDSGDLESIQQWVQWLSDEAAERGFYPDAEAEVEDEEPSEYEVFRDDVIGWAKSTLPPDVIAQLDYVFSNHGDPNDQAQATQWLIHQYQNQNHYSDFNGEVVAGQSHRYFQ